MSIKRLLITAGSVLALLPLSAHADRMNYSYIQATGLINTDLESSGADADGDGLGLRGGWIMGPYLFADGRYDDVDLNNDTDARTGALRLGLRKSIENLQSPLRLDIYGMLAVEAAEIESGATELLNDEGVGLVAGLRFGPVEPVEIGVEYNYTDLGDSSADFFAVEGIWNVSRWFGLVIEYRTGEYDVDGGPGIDRDDLNLGIRVQFGGDERRGYRRL